MVSTSSMKPSALIFRMGVMMLVAVTVLMTVACGGSSSSAASSGSGKNCRLLSTNEVKSIAGLEVTAVEPIAAAAAIGNCGNYMTSDNKVVLAFTKLASASLYDNTVKEAEDMKDTYTEQHELTGLGTKAMYFKGTIKYGIQSRYVVVTTGKAAFVMFPMSDSLTDDQIKQLAAKAVTHL